MVGPSREVQAIQPPNRRLGDDPHSRLQPNGHPWGLTLLATSALTDHKDNLFLVKGLQSGQGRSSTSCFSVLANQQRHDLFLGVQGRPNRVLVC